MSLSNSTPPQNLIQRSSKLPNSLPLYFNEKGHGRSKIKTSNACCFKWLMGTTNSMLSSNFCTFVSRARSFRCLFCSIISVQLNSLPLLCNFFFFQAPGHTLQQCTSPWPVCRQILKKLGSSLLLGRMV